VEDRVRVVLGSLLGSGCVIDGASIQTLAFRFRRQLPPGSITNIES
jgi:hypothetical protein